MKDWHVKSKHSGMQKVMGIREIQKNVLQANHEL